MKYVLVITGFVLLLLGGVTYWSYPNVASPLPVLYWVTDNNPAREQQVALFHHWLIDQGHGRMHNIRTMQQLERFRSRNWSDRLKRAIAEANDAGDLLWRDDTSRSDLPIQVRVPAMELRLDTANREPRKQVVQGVSGVASTIQDVGDGGMMRYFRDIGLLEPVTRSADRLEFSPAQTYDAIAPEITVDGTQYTFPANVYVQMFWVNNATFAEHDQPPPPKRWTIEQFEARGKAFVKAANQGGQRRVFFANRVPLEALHRSMGLSVFNETLTRCTLDDPRFVRSLRLLHEWTHEDHILPSSAEAASFDTRSGYGGALFQLFQRGNYAMVLSGRFALIQFRKFGAMDLAVTEPPHGGFANTLATTRAVGLYSIGDHKDLARHFLAFLASEPYNMQIVRDADALPPNPRYTETKQFKKPRRYPNEWGVHERFAQAVRRIGIGRAYSPFVLHNVVRRHIDNARNAVLAGQTTPEAAATEAAQLINDRIQQNLSDRPALREQHRQLSEQQQRIEHRRANNRPVPMRLIENPFHRRYYQHRGWAVTANAEQ